MLADFKKYKIAFAGIDAQNQIEAILKNDIVAVTKGQKIVAVGRVESISNLKGPIKFYF